MFFQYTICIFVVLRIIDSCIPTQQVEFARKFTVAQTASVSATSEIATISPSTSTTVATTTTSTTTTTTTTPTTTTTTTTTTIFYPCSSCSPIYDASCQGYQKPSASSYCLTSDEVPITYTLGPVSDLGLPADTCSTRIGCPSGTVARVNINGAGYAMGNGDGSPTLTYCSETDGIWYSDVDGHIYDVSAIACQYP